MGRNRKPQGFFSGKPPLAAALVRSPRRVPATDLAPNTDQPQTTDQPLNTDQPPSTGEPPTAMQDHSSVPTDDNCSRLSGQDGAWTRQVSKSWLVGASHQQSRWEAASWQESRWKAADWRQSWWKENGWIPPDQWDTFLPAAASPGSTAPPAAASEAGSTPASNSVSGSSSISVSGSSSKMGFSDHGGSAHSGSAHSGGPCSGISSLQQSQAAASKTDTGRPWLRGCKDAAVPKDASEGAENEEEEQQEDVEMDTADEEADVVDKAERAAAAFSTPAPWFWPRYPERMRVHIYLHAGHSKFEIVPMLIGRLGANMREIFEATGAKCRVRGQGSGHLELCGRYEARLLCEAPCPLMLAITANVKHRASFVKAVEMAVELLQRVSARYDSFCCTSGLPAPSFPRFTSVLVTMRCLPPAGRC